jgi:hypothetical protein
LTRTKFPTPGVGKKFYKSEEKVLAKNNGTPLYVDEKAQLNYKKNPIPTFALEILSSKTTGDGEKIGWFINKDLSTQYYCLVWFVECRNKLMSVSDITKIEVLIVSKEKLLFEFSSRGLTEDVMLEEARELRQNKVSGKHLIPNSNAEYYYYYSGQLAEKPVNLVVKKSLYRRICKSNYTVTKEGIVKCP